MSKTEFQEHDVVYLNIDVVPFKKGMKGTIIHMFKNVEWAEVEFNNSTLSLPLSKISKQRQ